MKTPDLSAPRSRQRLIAALAALVAVLVLAGVGVYGLLTGPPTANEDANRGSGPGPAVTAPGDPAPTATPRLPSVPASADPETFARNVATALFAWDTASGFMPLDYTSVILRSEEHTSELQSRGHLVCRLLLEKKNTQHQHDQSLIWPAFPSAAPSPLT